MNRGAAAALAPRWIAPPWPGCSRRCPIRTGCASSTRSAGPARQPCARGTAACSTTSSTSSRSARRPCRTTSRSSSRRGLSPPRSRASTCSAGSTGRAWPGSPASSASRHGQGPRRRPRHRQVDPGPLDSKSVLAFNLSYLFDRTELLDQALGEIAAWLASGAITAPPVTTYPLEDVARAHADIESGKTVGKLVLVP